MYDFNELHRIMEEYLKRYQAEETKFYKDQFKYKLGADFGDNEELLNCPCDLCDIRKWNDTYDFIANFKVKGE